VLGYNTRTFSAASMQKPDLPADLVALNARLKADPSLTEGMGPVHLLSVRGRVSGELRSTPVSPVDFEGRRWVVAGWANADWVKNLRASGWAILTKGRSAERITVAELAVDRRAPVLRAFAGERGGMGAFGLSADDPVERFVAVAERQPVFEIITAAPLEPA
jgi:deazaflavin-dependent oxidoreductase (nitroreductase family)